MSTNTTIGSAVYALSTGEGVGGTVVIDSDNLGWEGDELMIQLDMAGHPLNEGDSLIVLAQVGLQLTDANCTQEMHLRSAIIVGDSEDTPAWNDEIIDESWSGTDLIKQFVRTRTMRIPANITSRVVKVFMKPFSVPCGNGERQCAILNRSLTVIVIPRE